jgi:hypothetical protein
MARTRFSGPVLSNNGFGSIADSGKTLTIKAPDALTADTTLTFPDGAGSNGQYLRTNGTGTLTWAAGDGTGTVTSVALSGGTTGLTVSGSPVTTSGTITLAGVLAIANGGTNIGTVQALTGPGAVDLTSLVTAVSAEDPADALTLADGTAGQLKVVVYAAESDAGDTAVLTPANRVGYATITFADVGDTATLAYTGAGWAVIAVQGATVA